MFFCNSPPEHRGGEHAPEHVSAAEQTGDPRVQIWCRSTSNSDLAQGRPAPAGQKYRNKQLSVKCATSLKFIH